MGKQLTMKAQLTRSSLVIAAAAILRAEGPSAVTYRHVAEQAKAASSSVGYYFDSIDELLREAAEFNMRLWAQRAEKAASDAESLPVAEARERLVDLLLSACLPEDLVIPAAHYEQLMTAAQSDVVVDAYRRGRARLDAAINRIFAYVGLEANPRLVVAIVDGAAVAGISEGYPVRETARSLLAEVINFIKDY